MRQATPSRLPPPCCSFWIVRAADGRRPVRGADPRLRRPLGDGGHRHPWRARRDRHRPHRDGPGPRKRERPFVHIRPGHGDDLLGHRPVAASAGKAAGAGDRHDSHRVGGGGVPRIPADQRRGPASAVRAGHLHEHGRLLAHLGREVQGFIGMDFLRDYVVQFDWPNSRLRIMPRGTADPRWARPCRSACRWACRPSGGLWAKIWAGGSLSTPAATSPAASAGGFTSRRCGPRTPARRRSCWRLPGHDAKLGGPPLQRAVAGPRRGV